MISFTYYFLCNERIVSAFAEDPLFLNVFSRFLSAPAPALRGVTQEKGMPTANSSIRSLSIHIPTLTFRPQPKNQQREVGRHTTTTGQSQTYEDEVVGPRKLATTQQDRKRKKEEEHHAHNTVHESHQIAFAFIIQCKYVPFTNSVTLHCTKEIRR